MEAVPNVSIIIPCYNVVKENIDRCIDSILSQAYKDYEIIIVDDGSKREYSSILNKLTTLDNRIIVIHQLNGGVSAARNKGIELSCGKYIAFVDSDDCITQNYLTEAVSIAEEEQADIVYGYTYRGTEEYKKIQAIEKPLYNYIDDEWLFDRYFRTYQPKDKKSFGRGPYCRLLTRNLAQSVKFQPGIPIGEDVIWNLDILKAAKKKILVDSIWYNYIIRKESVTRKYSSDIEKRLMPFYGKIVSYLDNSDKSTAMFVSRLSYDYTNYILRLYLGNKENKDSFFKKWRESIQICKKMPWKKMIEAYRNKRVFSCLDNDTKKKILLLYYHLLFPIWLIHNRNK